MEAFGILFVWIIVGWAGVFLVNYFSAQVSQYKDPFLDDGPLVFFGVALGPFTMLAGVVYAITVVLGRMLRLSGINWKMLFSAHDRDMTRRW